MEEVIAKVLKNWQNEINLKILYWRAPCILECSTMHQSALLAVGGLYYNRNSLSVTNVVQHSVDSNVFLQYIAH